MNQESALSRSQFLKLSSISFLAILNSCSTYSTSEQQLNEFNKIELENLQRCYGIIIQNGNISDIPQTTGDPLNPADLRRGILILKSQLMKYPPEYFEYNGIQKVIMAEYIICAGQKANGISNGNTIGIRINSAEQNLPDYFLHEEIYHCSDYTDGGWNNNDYEWIGIHPDNCVSYENISVNGYNLCPEIYYANPNGREDPVQDAANFGEWMLTATFHKYLLEKIQQETGEVRRVLEFKYDYVKCNYSRWSNGKMNDRYWEDLIAGKVNEHYFI